MNTPLREQTPFPKPNSALAQAIAHDTHTAVATVQRIYEQEFTALARDAKITQFLSVLASRRVRLLLREH